MEVLARAFRKHLDLKRIGYEKIVKRNFEINKDFETDYTSNNLFEEEIKVSNSKFVSKIERGILIRKIFAENSQIILKFDCDFCIVYDEIYSKGNVEYNVFGKVGEAYHYFKLIPLENSSALSKIRNFVEKSIVSIGCIYIPKDAFNSFGSLEKTFLLKDGASIVSFPILDVANSSSKAFHSSKTLKLESEIIFFLKLKGLKDSEINNLILEDFLSY